MIKKADIILFIMLITAGLAASLWSVAGNSQGDSVKITTGDTLWGIYELDTDREIDIDQNGHHNHITIKDGTVSMTSSDCKNQICVNSGAISKVRDSIVCLPNKVVVEITSEKGGNVDVITG